MALGVAICGAWYYTILSGFYVLYCPVMYLMFLNHSLYRKVVDVLFSLWELYPVALFQWCYHTRIRCFGDYVNPNENTIIIMNHRTRVDWNYVWLALYHATKPVADQRIDDVENRDSNDMFDIICGGKSRIKFVLKDEIKIVPGMGWIMQLNYFLYVKRNWQEDQLNLSQFIDYYNKLECKNRIVLFPEGTDLSEDNKRRSRKFAEANNLQCHEYVLHPRTKGWVALCSRLRGSGLTSVYDVTVAYDNPANEIDLIRGKLPQEVFFHFKRYSIEEIPVNEDEIKSWINERWQDKESSLRKFHSDGVFIDAVTGNTPTEYAARSLRKAKLCFVFWTFIDILFLYNILSSVLFQFWVVYHSFLFIFVTWYFGGFQNVQYKILEKEL
ncbi:PREDICTED: lysocardiolipin acyltransferase 1-like isoform X1 [Papilio polytes]|uniref:lysocardiolipin acyltransferase 1-like isoform X1 n=1 Tax=Papilio polytes TaxID=76194 RepID=UPI000675C711|nr:PREDICTED: lysocardiolipin acyltransferase 1-like isoform X1 [Papilio polytes]